MTYLSIFQTIYIPRTLCSRAFFSLHKIKKRKNKISICPKGAAHIIRNPVVRYLLFESRSDFFYQTPKTVFVSKRNCGFSGRPSFYPHKHPRQPCLGVRSLSFLFTYLYVPFICTKVSSFRFSKQKHEALALFFPLKARKQKHDMSRRAAPARSLNLLAPPRTLVRIRVVSFSPTPFDREKKTNNNNNNNSDDEKKKNAFIPRDRPLALRTQHGCPPSTS